MKERREAGTATARLNFTCRNIFPHAALSAFISFLYAVAEIHFFNYTFHNSDGDIKRSIFLVFIVFLMAYIFVNWKPCGSHRIILYASYTKYVIM